MTSRKSNDAPASSRVRDNQRRSRTRRTELLKDLQERVNEYERQGVAATQEMQRAARRVALDNFRLRSLLALHGVSREEVESYLRLPDVASTSDAHLSSHLWSMVDHHRGPSEAQPSLLHSSAESPGHNQSRYVVDGHMDGDSQIEPHPQHTYAMSHSGITIFHIQDIKRIQLPIPEVAEGETDLQGLSGADEIIHTCSDVDSLGCQDSLGCFCAAAPKNESFPISSGLEISCQTAATIIIEMRGDGDEEFVRASLGCSGRKRCNVENTTVLQVMSEG